MTARVTKLLLTVLVIAALFAGCGGGDDDGGTTTAGDGGAATATSPDGDNATSPDGDNGDRVVSPSSRAEFVEQATAICKEEKTKLLDRANAYAAENPVEAGATPRESALRLFAAVQLPIIEAELDGLRDLGAPDEGEAAVLAFYDAEEAAIEAARNVKSRKSVQAMKGRFDAAGKLARQAGIPACANSSLITGE